MSRKFDAIVTGGGHNGLTCAAYLARAGLDVVLLERRTVVGGLSAEYEFVPGFRASMANSPGSLEPKVVHDLELARFGLKFNRPDPSLVMPCPDGRALIAWRDPARAAREIAKFSQRDVTAYRDLFDFLNGFGAKLGISLFEPPPTLREVAARLDSPADEEAFARLIFGSLGQLLDEYLECDVLKSAVAAISVTSNLVGPYTPGSAYLMLMRPLSLASSQQVSAEHDPRKQPLRGSTGLPVGGMGAIPRAMRHSFEASGGTVRVGCEVVRIVVENDAVAGVELADGEIIRAPIVASNLHPQTTLLDLLEPGTLDADFLGQAGRLPRRGSAFKMGLALDSLPLFAAAPRGLEREFASCQFRLAPTLEYMERAFDDAKFGKPSEEPIFLGLVPSVMDPSVAPPGKHIMSVNVFHAPTKLRDGDWTRERERYGLHCIDLMSRYIPNLKDILIDHAFLSPADLETEFGLRDANIMHLDMMPAKMFGLRPLAGWSHYRMPVRGLYLCGSGAWPGGTVSGIPGHNAAHRILADIARP